MYVLKKYNIKRLHQLRPSVLQFRYLVPSPCNIHDTDIKVKRLWKILKSGRASTHQILTFCFLGKVSDIFFPYVLFVRVIIKVRETAAALAQSTWLTAGT